MDDLFAGTGEMRRLCRAFDWSKTPLGAVGNWSHSLRTTVSNMLASPHPLFLWWGSELTQFYNDAFRGFFGHNGMHPHALGMRGPDCWTPIWKIIGPEIDATMKRAQTSWHIDRLGAIQRNGRLEEVYWTYSYTPVFDDNNSIGGVMAVCEDTTDRVVASRRLNTLHRIALIEPTMSAMDLAAECARTLAQEPRDAPFVLCFLNAQGMSLEPLSNDDDANDLYTLAYAANIPPSSALRTTQAWPIKAAVRTRQLKRVTLSPELPVSSANRPAKPVTAAVVVPLRQPNAPPLGALVVGLTPHLAWNQQYENFLRDAVRSMSIHITVSSHNAERERLYRALDVERARLESIFQEAPTFLAILRGPNYVVEMANYAFRQMMGHDDMVGRPLFDAVPEGRGQGFEEIMDRVLATCEPFIGRELPAKIPRAPGAPVEQRFVDAYYMPITEDDGTCSGIIVHGTEVTDHVKSRREVERLLYETEVAKQAAEQANAAKAQFLATMSHELRTPLNAIAGYTELLEMELHGPITDDQMQALRRIQTSQRHLLGLINDVLNYSRAEAGAVQYEIDRVSLTDTIRICEELTAPQMHAKRLRFSQELDGSTPLVMADGEKLRQIILNLLSNAIKFTPDNGTISVHLARVRSTRNIIEVQVSDNGRGIPHDQLESIFDPFFQIDARLTRTDQGLGLGLAISRDLARGMGGDLTAKSRVGVGSTFTLTLQAAIV